MTGDRDNRRDLFDEVICPKCGARVFQNKVARYEHDDCEPRQDDSERRREAVKRAYDAAAAYLTRQGHPEEAMRLFVKIGGGKK